MKRRTSRASPIGTTGCAWRRRELRLALYRHALRDGDRTETARQRVTALDVPTRRLRADLVRRLRDLREAEDAAFRLL